MIDFGEELRAAIDAIDPRLHGFFSAVANSFIRLEMLVLFRRAPQAQLSPAGIASELGWPEQCVREELAYLEQAGVVQRCPDQQTEYQLSSDPGVADLLNKFGFLYANRSSRLLILGHLLRRGAARRGSEAGRDGAD